MFVAGLFECLGFGGLFAFLFLVEGSGGKQCSSFAIVSQRVCRVASCVMSMYVTSL